MRLKEQTGLSATDLPVSQFKEHLRLGSGFGEESLQDTVLEANLRAAIAAIEARTGKVLIERTFVWQVDGWRQSEAQALPVAPVTSLSWMKLVTRAGDEVAVDLSTIVLQPSNQRPMLRSTGFMLPNIPVFGYCEIGFVAGYAPVWSGLPADLAQAVMILAAHFYEMRNAGDMRDGALPAGVIQLIERYRTVRILGGSPA